MVVRVADVEPFSGEILVRSFGISGWLGNGIIVAKQRLNAERERRIIQEIVADAHDEHERAMGWFSYLEDRLQFPFTARCVTKRAISPLRVGDEVEVINVAPEVECEREMFVMIRWERAGLGVPLSRLKPVAADEETVRAVADWHYWIAKGTSSEPVALGRVPRLKSCVSGVFQEVRHAGCELSGIHRPRSEVSISNGPYPANSGAAAGAGQSGRNPATSA